MEKNNKPGNVIQFPGKRKEEEGYHAASKSAPTPTVSKRDKSSAMTLGAAVVAIMLSSGAINKFVFSDRQQGSTTFALVSETGSGRSIASVDFNRNSAWEKELAEKLASPQARSIASVNIGRPATQEEKLRWGILEEKYTITYSPVARQIQSILLQGESSEPSYVLDREKFLREYGQLFESQYDSAKLKSIEATDQNTVESYVLFDKDNQPKGELRFELDRHKRLLSLKFDPVQI